MQAQKCHHKKQTNYEITNKEQYQELINNMIQAKVNIQQRKIMRKLIKNNTHTQS
jgi:hypothetical protein